MSMAEPATADEPTAVSARAAGPLRRGPRSRTDRLFLAASLLVTLWALFQNLFKLGTAPVLADEPTYVDSGWNYLHGSVGPPISLHDASKLVANSDNFEHPPLAKYLFGLGEWIGGSADSLTGARAVSALATLLSAAVIAVWLGRYAGRWTGLLAGALLTVLPEPASGSLGRFDRFAMLDPVAGLFMVLSVVLAWEWSRRSGRAAWAYAAGTGAAVGAAACSKENGFLGAVGPVLVVIGFALYSRQQREIWLRLGQAGSSILASLIVFVLCYLPLGHPIARIRYLITFQSAQSGQGHEIGFAGQVSSTPPWWANLWFAGHNYGPALTVFLVLAALCAVVLRRDRLTAWCLAALAAPFVFHCFIAKVALGYYWVMWTPMLLALAALGAAEVVKRAARVQRYTVPVAVVTGVAVLAVPAVASASESKTVAQIKPTGVEALPAVVAQHGIGNGEILSTGIGWWAFSYYLPGMKDNTNAAAAGADTRLIVISTVQCRDALDPAVRALAAVNLAAGHVTQVYADSQLTAYQVTGPLIQPTAAQVAAEPPSRATDGC